MNNKVNRLNDLATTVDKGIIKDARERAKNSEWLKYSQRIAIVVLSSLKAQNISQKKLAEKLGVTPQYVNKLVKGREKLNLETIARIEAALNIRLIEILMPKVKKKALTKIIHIDFNRKLEKNSYDIFKIAK